jgi:hypothetical protein
MWEKKNTHKKCKPFFLLRHHNIILRQIFFCRLPIVADGELFLSADLKPKSSGPFSYGGFVGISFKDNYYWSVWISTLYARQTHKVESAPEKYPVFYHQKDVLRTKIFRYLKHLVLPYVRILDIKAKVKNNFRLY